MREALTEAREAFDRREWRTALEAFRSVGAQGTLGADDSFRQADAAWWLGEIDDALAAYERAFRGHLDEGRPRRAAMAALLLGAHALERGEQAVGSGWVSRARRLLDDTPEGAEHGYPLYWDVFAALGRQDLQSALANARRMQDLGRRYDDQSLVAVGVMAEGRVLLKQGSVDSGLALLDEAMVMAVADELHPKWTGAIYCHLMDACHELQDLQRAAEWTRMTATWCDAVGEARVFRGICRTHRAQVFHQRGEWEQAEDEARRARDELGGLHLGTAAEAHYELGEILRLRGDLDGAEESFRRAHDLGRNPQPGLALLRARQGRADAACASLRAALAERSGNPLARAPLCAALVDIALAVGELETARAASAELTETAAAYGSDGLVAVARQARGAMLLAEDQPSEALAELRRACQLWTELQVPLRLAATRRLLGRAYRALDDDDAAMLEDDAAAATFRRLGLPVARENVAASRAGAGAQQPPDGLSPREVEILQLLAAGRTNQQIANELTISDKTVARHVANIYLKIDVSNRAAATAYAFRQGLVDDRLHDFM